MVNLDPNRPLFIVGCPRSGTTLLRSLLRAACDIYLPPEEFQTLVSISSLIRDRDSAESIADSVFNSPFGTNMSSRGLLPERAEMIDIFASSDNARDAMARLMGAMARVEQRPATGRWGDKTPSHVFRMWQAWEIWPDAQVINLVRDPREVVLSMRNAWGRSTVRSAVAWRSAVEAAAELERAGGDSLVRTVYFETLVGDPERVVSELCDWLGVDCVIEGVRSVDSEERWGRTSGATGVARLERSWRSDLRDAELRRIESICFDPMIRHDYLPELATKQAEPGRVRLKLAQLADAVRALKRYSADRGFSQALGYKLRQWREARR